MNKKRLLTLMGGSWSGYSYDFSTLADGTLPDKFTGATWSVSGGKAINSPTVSGSELIVNGSMEAGDPPDNWTAGGNGAALSRVEDERTGGAGSYSLNLDHDSNNFPVALQAVTTVANQWYRLSSWLKNIGTQYGFFLRLTNESEIGTILSDPFPVNIKPVDWTKYNIAGISLSTTTVAILRIYSTLAPRPGRFDDVSLVALDHSTLFSVLESPTSNVEVSANVTIGTYASAGVVLNLDSTVNPQNYVLAYHDKKYANLVKCVGGTFTSLLNTATTYVAGALIKVIKNGSAYQLYYNGTQVGTDQTISDAGIISNKQHGLFSTEEGNTFDSFYCK